MTNRLGMILVVVLFAFSRAILNSEEKRPEWDDREKLAQNNNIKDMQEDFGRYIYVSGEVVNPTKIDTRDQNAALVITLKMVLEKAGGVTNDASRFRLFIIRGHTVYRIDRSWGNLDLIQLDGGDLVFVSPKAFLDRKLISPEVVPKAQPHKG
jgi:hypothetical protein